MNDFFEAFNVGAGGSDSPALDLPRADYAENIWPDVPGFRSGTSAYFARGRRGSPGR